MKKNMRIVLVSGASSGLGEAMGKLFRQKGFWVVGVCRNAPDSEAADDFISADFAQAGESERVMKIFAERYDRLDVLINNAGFGAYATWEELEEAALRRLFEVDFFAPVLLTKAALPYLRLAERGTIINISSFAAKVFVPCMGAYCGVKAALRFFSDTLAVELCRDHINVLTVYPGRISTGFSTRTHKHRESPSSPGNKATSADEFAQKVFGAFEKRKKSLLYPWWYIFFQWIIYFFPGFYIRENIKRWKL